MYKRAATLAENNALCADGECKARGLKLSYEFWMDLFRVVKKWDYTSMKWDNSESAQFWPTVKRLGLSASQEFIQVALQLLNSNNPNDHMHAAELYCEGLHVRLNLPRSPRTPQEDLENSMECIHLVNSGIAQFHKVKINLACCPNFYELKEVQGGWSFVDYGLRKVYLALMHVLKNQLKTYAGPKTLDAYQEIVEPFIQKHVVSFSQVTPVYQKELNAKIAYILKKYKDKWLLRDAQSTATSQDTKG